MIDDQSNRGQSRLGWHGQTTHERDDLVTSSSGPHSTFALNSNALPGTSGFAIVAPGWTRAGKIWPNARARIEEDFAENKAMQNTYNLVLFQLEVWAAKNPLSSLSLQTIVEGSINSNVTEVITSLFYFASGRQEILEVELVTPTGPLFGQAAMQLLQSIEDDGEAAGIEIHFTPKV